MADAGTIIGIAVAVILGLVILYNLYWAILLVREREEVIIERCGRFSRLERAGCHCLVPCLDRPKMYHHEFFMMNTSGQLIKEVRDSYRVLMKTEVVDTPRLSCYTKDSAHVMLDAIMNFRITSSKTMIYSTQNVPRMMSKLMQAQVRAVAGQLDVDQLIESNAAARAANRVTAEMAGIAKRWGVHVDSVKFQNVDVGELEEALARAKNASLSNNALFLKARAHRQTTIINAEAEHVKMVREMEGTAAQIVAGARGKARAIENVARGEAETARVVGTVVAGRGENVTRYLLAMKYIAALRTIASRPNTTIHFLPRETSLLQTMASLGLNTIAPSTAK